MLYDFWFMVYVLWFESRCRANMAPETVRAKLRPWLSGKIHWNLFKLLPIRSQAEKPKDQYIFDILECIAIDQCHQRLLLTPKP